MKTKYFCPVHFSELYEYKASVGGGGLQRDFKQAPKGKVILWDRRFLKCLAEYCGSEVVVLRVKIEHYKEKKSRQ